MAKYDRFYGLRCGSKAALIGVVKRVCDRVSGAVLFLSATIPRATSYKPESGSRGFSIKVRFLSCCISLTTIPTAST